LIIIAATCFDPSYWPSSGISVVFRLVQLVPERVWQTSRRINRTSRKISELPENGQ